MPRLGPELVAQILVGPRIGERAQIVDQGVDPDVHHLLGVPRHRHAPRLPDAAEAEVTEAALDEAARLVVAEPRDHEVRPLVVQS